MISDYTKLQAAPNMTIEANWNSTVTPGKAFKVTIDGKEAIMERDDLYSLMMIFGDEEQQTDLIPVTKSQVRAITRLLTIKAQKDIRKGEPIKFYYEYFVPEGIYESLLLTDPKHYSSSNLTMKKLEKDINKVY